MPGPIDIDPSTINPKSDIAYKDDMGNWRAGPDASGYQPAQFVDVDYAMKARGIRRRTNLVKAIQRSQEVSEAEARELTEEMLNELEGVDDEDRREEIWKKYGS